MDKIYTSIINFFDENNQIDYEKTRSLIQKNLKNGSKKFYIAVDNYNFSNLDCTEKQKYYKKTAALMPLEAELIFDLNFNSKKEYEEIISELDKLKENYKLIISIPYINEEKKSSQRWDDYISFIDCLSTITDKDIYLKIKTGTFRQRNKDKLLFETQKNDKIRGFMLKASYPFDLNIDELNEYQEKYNSRFDYLIDADDFYYLNIENDVQTISKYINLVPEVYKNIYSEFKNSNFEKAKELQLELNDFIMSVEEIGRQAVFNYFLSERLNFEANGPKSLSLRDKNLLKEELKKINVNMVDKV